MTRFEAESARVLDDLIEARLVVGESGDAAGTGNEMVEVAHEALIRDWPRLQGWLEESREALRYERRLSEKATEWDASIPRRHPDLLLRSEMLEEALQWERAAATPEAVIQEFLAAGRAEIIVVDRPDGLMWTRKDNGNDIDWHAANEYAKRLRLGGYSDWRLPTIEELEQLSDPLTGDRNKIRKPFRPTGVSLWSFTKDGELRALFFSVTNGRRAAFNLSHIFSCRVYCVRRSKK